MASVQWTRKGRQMSENEWKEKMHERAISINIRYRENAYKCAPDDSAARYYIPLVSAGHIIAFGADTN